MRCMKWVSLAVIAVSCLLFPPAAEAIEVTQPPAGPVKTDSPIIITGYGFQGPQLYYVQLFNSSNEVIDVTGWSVQYTVPGVEGAIAVAHLQGLVRPGGYIVIGNKAVLPSADVVYELTLPAGMTASVNSLRVIPSNNYLDLTLAVKADPTHRYWKRNISTSTGNYLSTFTAFTPDTAFVLYGQGFYDYPTSTALQVSELLPNPRNCSPLESAADCGDYVKLYNPSTEAIDLSTFRLRVGYQGQNPSSSNTFALAGTIQPGHYAVVAANKDGQPISLTNSGAFVWLEDTYGVMRYDSTVLEYPDASADAKKGQAWAYDIADGTWKWTIQPAPHDSPSIFPAPAPPKPKVVATSVPAPCKQGQYRSEETGRCRSIASDVTTLAPCDDDEERNPATNRCRKLASLASAQLAPCKEGQERNRETNRCRNVAASSPPDAAFAVEPVKNASKAFVGWWALGGVGAGAVGYGLWEWRQEALRAIQKIGSFFISSK